MKAELALAQQVFKTHFPHNLPDAMATLATYLEHAHPISFLDAFEVACAYFDEYEQAYCCTGTIQYRYGIPHEHAEKIMADLQSFTFTE